MRNHYLSSGLLSAFGWRNGWLSASGILGRLAE